MNSPGDPPLRGASVEGTKELSRCRFLRTKTMHYDFHRDSALSIGPACDTASYRCVKTSRVVGPDGEPVNPDLCLITRPCFEK